MGSSLNGTLESKEDKRSGWARFFDCKWLTGYWTELLVMWKLSWPISLSQLFEATIFSMTLMFVGHLGKEYLDGVTLGVTAVNVAGYSVAYGVNSACDTLFSQTNGSKNMSHLGVLLQKALCINFLLCLFCAAIFFNSDLIFILLGQDRNIARIAGLFAMGFIPTLPMFCFKQVLSKYLFAQSIVRPTLVILMAMNIIHALLLTLFLCYYQLGLFGVSLSLGICYTFGMACHALYIYKFNINAEIWTGWSYKCLLDWKTFCCLALSGTVMVCSSWWAFEVYAVLTGLLGSVELGTHGIAFQVVVMMGMANDGIGAAVSVRVGNLLGSGDSGTAKKVICVVFPMTFSLGVVLISGLVFGRYLIPQAFSTNGDIVAMFASIVPILAAYNVADSLKFLAQGVLSGIGRQQCGGIVNLMMFMLFVPVGYFLMFKTQLKLKGTWIAILSAEVFRGLLLYIRLIQVDWEEEIELAAKRSKEQNSDENYNEMGTSYGGCKSVPSSRGFDQGIASELTPCNGTASAVPSTVKRTLIFRGLILIALLLILGASLLLNIQLKNHWSFLDLSAANKSLSHGSDIVVFNITHRQPSNATEDPANKVYLSNHLRQY